ncbi:MAG: hypothetical protein U1E91_06270 [Moraxella sp.]
MIKSVKTPSTTANELMFSTNCRFTGYRCVEIGDVRQDFLWHNSCEYALSLSGMMSTGKILNTQLTGYVSGSL